jgi:hypothetical protein
VQQFALLMERSTRARLNSLFKVASLNSSWFIMVTPESIKKTRPSVLSNPTSTSTATEGQWRWAHNMERSAGDMQSAGH